MYYHCHTLRANFDNYFHISNSNYWFWALATTFDDKLHWLSSCDWLLITNSHLYKTDFGHYGCLYLQDFDPSHSPWFRPSPSQVEPASLIERDLVLSLVFHKLPPRKVKTILDILTKKTICWVHSLVKRGRLLGLDRRKLLEIHSISDCFLLRECLDHVMSHWIEID